MMLEIGGGYFVMVDIIDLIYDSNFNDMKMR